VCPVRLFQANNYNYTYTYKDERRTKSLKSNSAGRHKSGLLDLVAPSRNTDVTPGHERGSRPEFWRGGLFPDLADVVPTLAFFARDIQCGATYRERRDVARLCANLRPFGPALAFFSSATRGFSRYL
jgi:hypothetical protein